MRAEGPASGVEKSTRLSGGVVAVDGEGTEAEEVGLLDLEARRGLMLFREGLGVGSVRRRA